ncbi:MAG: hypothetical protein AAGJ32_02560 [Pseudomonadota bacterium]
MTKPDTVSDRQASLPIDNEETYEADLRLLLHYFRNIPSQTARSRVIAQARKASLSETLARDHFPKFK